MSETSMHPDESPERADDEVSLLDYLGVIWVGRGLVATVTALAILGTLAYCLISPPYYKSTATILAPKEGGALSGLKGSFMASALMGGVPGLSPSSLSPNRDLFLGILGSETMARDLVTRFELRERWGTELMVDAIDALRTLTKIQLTETGTIQITVEETDPELAAEIASFYVDHLNKTLTGLETTEASKQRKFLEARLGETEGDLAKAEEALKEFQETHKAFALQEQARGLVEEVARLKGQIIAEEVMLEGMKTTASEKNPDVVRTRRRIDVMKEQLYKQFGRALDIDTDSEDASDEQMLLPFKDFPELGLDLARLMRDVKIQTTVYSLLTQQLEEAKISEARDMPKVQFLDRPMPAERKSRPKIRLSMMIAACGGFVAGIFLCFVLQFVERVRLEFRRQRGEMILDDPRATPSRATREREHYVPDDDDDLEREPELAAVAGGSDPASKKKRRWRGKKRPDVHSN